MHPHTLGSQAAQGELGTGLCWTPAVLTCSVLHKRGSAVHPSLPPHPCCTGGLRQGDLHTLSEYHSLRRKRAAERKAGGPAGGRPLRAPVPSHFLPTDVSDVPVEVDVLRGASVALLNLGAYSKVGKVSVAGLGAVVSVGERVGAWAGGDGAMWVCMYVSPICRGAVARICVRVKVACYQDLPVAPLGAHRCHHCPAAQRELESLVKRLGGVTHQNAGLNTTYLVAAEPGGYKYKGQVEGDRQDILAVGWLQECLEQGRLVEHMPRHLLHLCAMVGGGVG
jgi:hypothetical protein